MADEMLTRKRPTPNRASRPSDVRDLGRELLDDICSQVILKECNQRMAIERTFNGHKLFGVAFLFSVFHHRLEDAFAL